MAWCVQSVAPSPWARVRRSMHVASWPTALLKESGCCFRTVIFPWTILWRWWTPLQKRKTSIKNFASGSPLKNTKSSPSTSCRFVSSDLLPGTHLCWLLLWCLSAVCFLFLMFTCMRLIGQCAKTIEWLCDVYWWVSLKAFFYWVSCAFWFM